MCPSGKSVFPQNVEWAKKTKKGGTAVDSRCKLCATVARTWPGLTWEGLVAKARCSAEFKGEVELARLAVQDQRFDSFHKQSYDSVANMSLEMTKEFVFIGATEFESAHGLKLQDVVSLAPFTVEIPNELNKLEKGLLVQPEGAHRRVRVTNTIGTAFATHIHEGPRQLRAKQGDSVKAVFDEQVLKERPKGLGSAGATLKDVAAAVERAKQEPPPQAEVAPEPAVAAPLAGTGLGEEPSEDEVLDETEGLPLPDVGNKRWRNSKSSRSQKEKPPGKGARQSLAAAKKRKTGGVVARGARLCQRCCSSTSFRR